jgi:hypothetical protein
MKNAPATSKAIDSECREESDISDEGLKKER